MHPVEIKTALENMVVLIDTREQDNRAFRQRIKQMNCKTERKKLDFGDYSVKIRSNSEQSEWIDFSEKIAIERKYAIDELAQCYCKQRKRFKAEFERAKESGAKIYLLIENGSFEKVYAGRYRTQMNPQALIASMLAWLARYDCQIIFCAPETSGKLIKDILYREAKERLERGI